MLINKIKKFIIDLKKKFYGPKSIPRGTIFGLDESYSKTCRDQKWGLSLKSYYIFFTKSVLKQRN